MAPTPPPAPPPPLRRGRLRRTGAAVLLAALPLAGCAVVEIASDQGCATYFVLGLGPLRLWPDDRPPGVQHLQSRHLGLYAVQGPGVRLGLGYLDHQALAVDPRLDAVQVERSTDAEGRQRVAVRNSARQENDHAAPASQVVCLRDGLGTRRLRE